MKIALLIFPMVVLFTIGCGTLSNPREAPSGPASDPVNSQPNSVPPLLTTLPTATSVPDLDLESLIVVEGDMPEGFNLVGQGRVGNRAVSRDWSDSKQWLENFESWGRIEGFDAAFENGDQDANISVSLAIYRGNYGAQQAFRRINAEIESDVKKTFKEQDVNLIGLEELEDPILGDESVAFHIRASTQVSGTPTSFDLIIVSFRQENVLGSATWFSSDTPVLLSDVVALAKKQLDRIS